MRLLPVLGLCLAFSYPAVAFAHHVYGEGDALVLLRTAIESGPPLQEAGYHLVAEVPEGYLAFLDGPALAEVSATGLSYEVLVARDDASLEYVIVYDPQPGHEIVEPAAESVVLHAGRGYRVMSVPAASIDGEPTGVSEIQRVFRRPLSFVRTPWMEPHRAVSVDPEVAAGIATVNAAALQSGVQTLQDFGTRYSQYNGGYLASVWIRDQFLSYGYTDVTFHDYNSWNDNVVCVKPGAVWPDEVVVIGAHYDSTNPSNNNNAPGADDNATGTTGVLEAARILADLVLERTVIFVCFSGEEQGLVGSEAWATQAASSGMNIVGMVNLDMICYRATADAEDLDIISNGSSDPLADLAYEAVAAYVPELAMVDGYLTAGTSDHASFWAAGFRAIFLFEDSGSYSPYIHTSNDRVGTSANDFAFMVKNVKAATATLATLARPFHVAIAHDPLGNSEGSGPFGVLAEIIGAQPLDPSGLALHYRVDGGAFVDLPLLPTGQANQFGATIPAVPVGSAVEYYLSAADIDGYLATLPEGAPGELFQFRTGVSLVFVEDAETDQGWTLGVPGDNATTGLWIRDDPIGTSYQPEDDHTPGLGVRCFVTGNAPAGSGDGTNDVDGGCTTLLSPVFDLDGADWAEVSYWRWYADETSHDDDFIVDVSNDGGTSWHSLEVVTDSAYPWVHAVIGDLGAILPLTAQMRLRFIAEDTGSGSLVEAAIDDLEIAAVFADPTGVGEPMAGSAPLRIFPSPLDPQSSILMYLPSAGRAQLRIFDVTGAEVGRPVDGALSAGGHAMTWGTAGLPSGVYLAKLTLDGAPLASQKLIRLR